MFVWLSLLGAWDIKFTRFFIWPASNHDRWDGRYLLWSWSWIGHVVLCLCLHPLLLSWWKWLLPHLCDSIFPLLVVSFSPLLFSSFLVLFSFPYISFLVFCLVFFLLFLVSLVFSSSSPSISPRAGALPTLFFSFLSVNFGPGKLWKKSGKSGKTECQLFLSGLYSSYWVKW